MRSLFILFFLLQTCTLLAAVGNVKNATGDAYLLRKFKKMPLTAGLGLEPKDNIYTKSGSAELEMEDGSLVELGPKSHFKVRKYDSTSSNPDRDVLLFKGASRFKVAGLKTTKEESFLVRTPTAVAGVRGTDFSMISNEQQTVATVFEGEVGISSPEFAGTGSTQVLTEGLQSTVAKGQAPSKPVRVPAKQLNAIKSATSSTSSESSGETQSGGETQDAGAAPTPTESNSSGATESTEPQTEAAADTPETSAESTRESIQQETLENIQETVVEEVLVKDPTIFDTIKPIAPPTNQD